MRARTVTQKLNGLTSRSFFLFAAVAALTLAADPVARAQSVDFSPVALGKQRAAIILKATHAPIADLESDVNHLAVLSETCRAESGAKACGLSDKPLGSTTLEDRYAYYVRKPMEAHASGRQAKVDRHNWEVPSSASR
jgi:hypothetical protein